MNITLQSERLKITICHYNQNSKQIIIYENIYSFIKKKQNLRISTQIY